MSRPSYETQARRRKAVALSDWCRQTGITAAMVVAMSDATRRQACEDAGVNVASDETWAVVVGLLGAAESPAYQAAVSADDPFRGLVP